MTSAKAIVAAFSGTDKNDIKLIEQAYQYAAEAHKDHVRKSGEPYMIHTAAVALKLAEMGMGPRTIAAGLLHDTIEDTAVTSEDIKNDFGEEILFLVEGVTKLSSVRYYGTDRHNESLRKLFVATSQDIRVLIIKLVDRLHNMQTLEHVSPEKQQRIARETLEIYVPVAHRLGMGRIRKELEDLAFPYVYPEEFDRVKTLLNERGRHTEETLERERKNLQKKLADAGLTDFHTSFRVKGFYSLYHKLKRKEWDMNNVFDLMAMRIVVSSVEDCYKAMGIVHQLWRPLPKRVKDYINFPKPNGYQSIHTTVITPNGAILEIQIRTEQMHQEAEYGVASHIIYKNATTGMTEQQSWFSQLVPHLFRPFSWRKQHTPTDIETVKHIPPQHKIPHWIQQIGEMYTKEKATGDEFVADMRKDFFENRIFAFTPNGDVVDLPVGATPIDFAYAIHSEIGDKVAGAKVNKKLVQLDTVLRNGDIVEIETKKSAHPTQKWLGMAKTSLAKRRIRSALAQPE
jgi:GTP pyrophosphokinase